MPEPGDDVTQPDTPPAPAPSTGLSQEQVAAIAAREKDQGGRAEKRRIAQALGMDPETFDPAAIKRALDVAREADEARMSDVEKREKAAQQLHEQATTAVAQAASERHTARLERALVRAGVQDGTLDDARTLLSTLPADAEDKDVVKAVEALKGRLPALFQITTAPPLPSGGSPTGTPPRQQPTGDAYTRGAERARALGLVAPAAS